MTIKQRVLQHFLERIEATPAENKPFSHIYLESVFPDDIYARLGEAGIEVLYDDRSETAGVKFNDADLLGLPLRIVVSARNLAQDAVEVKGRSASDAATVPNADLVHHVREMLLASSPQEAEKML